MRACILFSTLGNTAQAGEETRGHAGSGAGHVSRIADMHAQGLWLGIEEADAVRAHVKLSDELVAHPSIEKTCSLVDSAQQLAPLLAKSLDSRHATSVSQAFGGADASAFKAFETLARQEDALLVGIGMHVGAEAAYAYVRYDEIADVGVVRPDAAALLRAAAGLRRNPSGWPVHVEQQTDTTGCQDPGALVEPLQRIKQTWERAPECVRSLVGEVARQSVRDALSSASCYCRRQETVVEDSIRLAALVAELDLGIPTAEVTDLSIHLRSDGARFECIAN